MEERAADLVATLLDVNEKAKKTEALLDELEKERLVLLVIVVVGTEAVVVGGGGAAAAAAAAAATVIVSVAEE